MMVLIVIGFVVCVGLVPIALVLAQPKLKS